MREDPRALLLIISKKRIDDERPPSFPVRRQFLSFPPGPVPFRLIDRAKPARYAAGKVANCFLTTFTTTFLTTFLTT